MDEGIKNIIKESYDKNARLRDRSDIVQWKIDEMEKFCGYLARENKNSLLDLGAGAGQYGKFFENKGMRVTCADISTEMITACKEKGLEAYVMDFYAMDFGGRQFDAVWAQNSLLHVPKASLGIVLQNIKRFLKQDGLLYMGVYGGRNSEGVWEKDTYSPKRFFSFFDDKTIKKMVEQHFCIVNFDTVQLGEEDLHYQALILRNT